MRDGPAPAKAAAASIGWCCATAWRRWRRATCRVGAALDALAKRVGFRVIPGLSERVVYRELFPRGLTLLDREHLEDFSLSHVGARAELRALVAALALPGWNPAKLAA